HRDRFQRQYLSRSNYRRNAEAGVQRDAADPIAGMDLSGAKVGEAQSSETTASIPPAARGWAEIATPAGGRAAQRRGSLLRCAPLTHCKTCYTSSVILCPWGKPHEAAGLHHPVRRRCSRVAARGARAAADDAGDRVTRFHIAWRVRGAAGLIRAAL